MTGDLWLVVAVLLGAAAVGIAVLIAVTITIRRLERSTPDPRHPSQLPPGIYPWERDT